MEKQTILVVDDEDSSRVILQMILSEEYNVIEACSGSEALKKIYNQTMDLVTLDVSISDMNGLELLKLIREITNNIPVIVVTTFRKYEALAVKLGAFTYLTKPIEVDQVKTAVREALEASKSKKVNIKNKKKPESD